eukprot:TRINITY_DN31219_c0_g1_i1.p1 TRINITY_DN31219_c0_g1~~TRINITY_DN31219_c0_g1_i1.p1  ORF type:complete len:403 (+),score=53.16 TRINITY_DN31219_c0_g1_i1:49-1257(+)
MADSPGPSMRDGIERVVYSQCPRRIAPIIFYSPWAFAALLSITVIVVSVRILQGLLETELLLIIALMCCLTSFMALYLSLCIARRNLRWEHVGRVRLISASSFAILMNISIFMLDHVLLKEQPEKMDRMEYVIPVAAGLGGLGASTGVLMHTAHHFYINCFLRLKHYVDRRRIMFRPAQVVECEEMECGTCVVCMEELSLADLPDELAFRPEQPKHTIAGLLQYPCGHVFHGACASRWLEEEVTCPSCRSPIKDMGKCSRFVLKAGSRQAAEDLSCSKESADCSLSELTPALRETTGGEIAEMQLPASRQTLEGWPSDSLAGDTTKACLNLPEFEYADEEVPIENLNFTQFQVDILSLPVPSERAAFAADCHLTGDGETLEVAAEVIGQQIHKIAPKNIEFL